MTVAAAPVIAESTAAGGGASAAAGASRGRGLAKAAGSGAGKGAVQAGVAYKAGRSGAQSGERDRRRSAGGRSPSTSSSSRTSRAGSSIQRGAARTAKRVTAKHPVRVLIAELLLCVVILGLSPLSKDQDDTDPGDWMRQASAIMGLFFLLGLVAAIGPKSGKAAAAFGGLITLVLLVDQRELFRTLGRLIGTKAPTGQDLGEGLASRLGGQ